MANDYDNAAGQVLGGQVGNIRTNVALSATTNPDQEAQYQHLAKFVNAPVDTVRADPEAIKQQAAAQQVDADRIATDMPHLAKFLGDIDTVRKIHDDVHNAQAIEQVAKPVDNGLAADLWTGIKHTGMKILGAWDKAAVTLDDALPDGTPGKMTPDERQFFAGRGAFIQSNANQPENVPQHWTGQVTSGLSYAPFLAAAPLVAGASEGTARAQELLDQGVDPSTAGRAGAAEGTLMGALQMVPMGKLLFGQGAASLAKSAVSSTLKAGAVGAAQSVGSDSAAAALLTSGGYGTLATQYAPSLQKAWDSALFMAGLHLGTQGAHRLIAGAPLPAPLMHEVGEVSQAEQQLQRLQEFSNLAIASKWRDRDSEQFKDFVTKATAGGPLENLYVDGRELANVLNQSGVSLDELRTKAPDVADQLAESLHTGSDVRISGADYAAHLAHLVGDDLLPHLKTDPAGKTYAEIQQFYQGQADQMQAAAHTLAAETVAKDAHEQSKQAVFDDVLRQVNATGRFTPDVGKAYAALHREFFSTLGERLGVTPEEAYREHGANVVADTPGTLDGADNRASYDPASRTISLLGSADLSSFLHESGHHFLDTYARIAGRADGPDAIREDMGHILNWTGVESVEKWHGMTLDEQRAAHEKFAQGFESYLMEGKAPSLEMQGIFSRFRSWLVNVYKSVRSLGVELNPEVRSVMNRMLASEDTIRDAEAVRGYQMPFNNEQDAAAAGIDHDGYAKIKAAHDEATQQAIAGMQDKSLRDMRWLGNAKSKAMKALQREAHAEREKIKGEVAKEIAQEPIEQARVWLRTGEMKTPNGEEIKATKGFKLNTDAVHEMYPEGALSRPDLNRLRGMTNKDGLHPDIVADMFGFNSGDHLVRELITGESTESKVRALTDVRMLEEHGELSNRDAIEQAAEAAIHNDARAKFMATGLKVLAKSPISAHALADAAKEAAEGAIAAKKVGDINPRTYTAGEARANREMLKLAPKDPAGAVDAQRRALLNNQLAKAAMAAQDDVRRALTYFKRFDKASVRDKLPGSFVEQIDALLAQFDFRQVPTGTSRPKENLLNWANGLREIGYEPQIAEWLNEFDRGQHYQDMTMEQFRGVYDTVRSIEATAKSTREITRKGEKVLVEAVVQDLIGKMDERGEKFTRDELVNPPQAGVDGVWKAATHWLGVKLRMVDADLTPQEYKFNRWDMHDLDGPFRETLFDPVLESNYKKVDMTRAASNAAEAMGKILGKDWQSKMFELVDNPVLRDPRLADDKGIAPLMKITRAKLLGIMRHMGNESNFDKLTKGYGWDPGTVWKWVAEHATEKDWQATQAHWDAFDPLWKETEDMVRRIGGTTPPKIPARPFEVSVRNADGTTKKLEIRGGYSPIDYDPISSKLSARKGEFDLGAGDKVAGENMLYRATTTSNGSLVARSQGYSDYVNLDIHSAESRIRDTIHDIAYREALLDASKIVNHSDFREKFMLTYGKEEYQALNNWLRDIRDMYMIDGRNRGFENALQYARQGVIMTGIAYRLSTVVKHGTSAALKSLGYLGNADGAKYFASRVTRMASGHLQEDIAGAQEKFAEIRTRMLQMDRDYKVGNRSMYEGEDWRAKNDRFGHAMVAWSDALSAIPTAWAAYDLATTKGVPESMGGTGKPMSEADAVAYANSVVRQAHGSALEVTRSNFLQAKGVKGLFGTIYGFMNNSYGQTRDMYDKAFAEGSFNNNPALVARALSTVIVPALIAHWVSHGGPDDDKDPWWKWSAKAVAGEVAGMVPFVRDAASMLNYEHSDQTVAPIRLIADLIKSGKDIGKEANGEHSRIVQDLANTVGEWAHIGGLGQAGKTLQYLRDVAEGREHPDSNAQAVHDAALGPKH